MYKLVYDNLAGKVTTVLRLEDMAAIPMNPDNTDYQAYLAWCAEGNTPEGATE